MFKELPTGFVKMNLSLMFKEGEQCDLLENEVLKMIVRDWYLLYSKKVEWENGGKKWWRYYFYCQPGKQEEIAYNMGIYSQEMLRFQSKKGIINAIHSVPDGFPKCIQVKLPKEKKV